MRFSYAIIALIGAAQAIPTVGSVVTERGVCNSAEECKGVARAIVADQAALEARKKSKAAKGAAGNATAAAASKNNNNKARSKQLIKDEAEEEEEDVEARALGDAVDSLVGEGTGLLDDVTSTVGLKTRDGNEVRAAVTDSAALEARKKSKASKGAAGNATAAAASSNNNNKGRSANLMDGVGASGTLEARKKNKKAKNATADAAAAADAGAAAARRSRRSYKLF
ncbi:hypothetical protein J7T55_001732 [Diaporthe amygdali]|uniref:uncharacterized protein n=1 Tax=Phomopsis amygdali TaxID=1214568 RepID=UPI0022FE1B38|nr:uncharacterized protein J7T55_001732 [Diaporthe amygdali]KAJ0104245.1 hypothetical protein J7T55_001732 [Diaporthe amygdali]